MIVLAGLLIPWVMASNRGFPNCPFFHSLHVGAVRSFFDIKLSNINIESLRGEDISRRNSGSFQLP